MVYQLEITTPDGGHTFRARIASEDGTQGVWCDALDAGTAAAQAVKLYTIALGDVEREASELSRPIATRFVGVDPDSIENILRIAIGASAPVRIDYTDSEGHTTRNRLIRPLALRSPTTIRGRVAVPGATVLVQSIDVDKDEVRHFRLDRIERVESVD
jgi:predicted DNA-binding transcriptional regulator YafY